MSKALELARGVDALHEKLCCDEHELHHKNGERWCWTCALFAAERLANLASCLRVGAGLEVAWKLSEEAATFRCDRPSRFSDRPYAKCNNALPCAYHNTGWRPGCGRALAGWEVGA